MRNREEYNAYMKAYQQRKRDNMTFEEWRAFRDKDNVGRRAKYHAMTPEEKQKHKEYQHFKQKRYYFNKNN